MSKVPYTIIIGQNEVDSNTISYRHISKEETVNTSLDEFISNRHNDEKDRK